MKNRIVVLFTLLTVVLSTSGFSCTLLQGSTKGKQGDPSKKVTLEYWRVFDDSDVFVELIGKYRSTHPNVTINYKKLRYEEYESELLNAMAEDRGPDLLSIHSTWVDRYLPKVQPMPKSVSIGRLVEKGAVKKTTVAVFDTVKGLTAKDVREKYVDVVAGDVLRGEKGKEEVYGVPLSLDTLALFYNKDLFNNAGIIDYPRGWDDFQHDVGVLTSLNSTTGDIERSGAAFGTAGNVQRSNDLLASLMMQNGAEMASAEGAAFDKSPRGGGSSVNPSVDALRFYTDFASPTKEIYTWNEDQPDSFEAFVQGRTAMFFGYSYHAALLKDTAPQLHWGMAPLPQLAPSKPANVANYWIESVSKKAKDSEYAWDFLFFLASEEQTKAYLEKTQKPTALRSFIAEQQQTEHLGAFASQVLFAKNWYHGKDPAGMESAFQYMIKEALLTKGGEPTQENGKLQEIIGQAVARINAGY